MCHSAQVTFIQLIKYFWEELIVSDLFLADNGLISYFLVFDVSSILLFVLPSKVYFLRKFIRFDLHF